MPRSQRNDNFIDKSFTVMADIILKIMPASKKEKEALLTIGMGCRRREMASMPKL
jgi:hypothetical protein